MSCLRFYLGCALMLVKVWAHNLFKNSRICYFRALWAHFSLFWCNYISQPQKVAEIALK